MKYSTIKNMFHVEDLLKVFVLILLLMVQSQANPLPIANGKLTTDLNANTYNINNSGRINFNAASSVVSGTGSPNGVVTAPVGSVFLRLDGITGTTLYSKVTGSGNTGWSAITAGAGTVTSVALTTPGELTVSGSPITTSGTFALSWSSQTANLLFASPSGSSGTPGFRAMTGADVPASIITNAKLANMAANTFKANNTGSPAAPSDITVAQAKTLLAITASDVSGLAAIATSGSASDLFTGTAPTARLGSGTADATKFLRGDSTWQAFTSGTVTSVGLSMPSVFTVANSPVTSSGTLAVTFAGGQTANEVMASPDGSSGAVALRALVANDIPSLDASKITTGTLGAARLPVMVGDSGAGGTQGAVPAPGAGDTAAGKFLKADGTFAIPSGTSTGTVTSVAATVPAEFLISGSPITTSGTLAITKATESANTFWAGPTSGGAAAPIFRVINTADLGSGTADSSHYLRGDLTWATISAITGTLTSPRVPFANGASSLTDSALLSFSTSTGLDIRPVGDTSGGHGNAAAGINAGISYSSYTNETFFGVSAGQSVATGDSGTFIGSNAGMSGGGGASISSGSDVTIVGAYTSVHSNGNARCIGIGSQSYVGSHGIGVGWQFGQQGDDMLTIGYNIGNVNQSGAAIIANTNVGYTDIYFGNGLKAASPVAYTIHGVGGSGSNIAGGDITLAGGQGTGTGVGGDVHQKTAPAGTTGSSANSLVERQLVRAKPTTLTNSSATSLFDIALPTLKMAGGVVHFSIQATDGTDVQSYTGDVAFSAVNKAGTYTTSASILGTAATAASGVTTLTASFGFSNGTNKTTLQCTPVSSLTPTSLTITYTVDNESPQDITPL